MSNKSAFGAWSAHFVLWLSAACIAVPMASPADAGEPEKKPTPPASVVPSDANVTGKAVFEGKPPVRRPINMAVDPVCAQGDQKPLTESVIVDPQGGLRNVIVWVKSGLPDDKPATPKESVLVDQSGCVYTPHVFCVMTGQKVIFRNSDATLHNVHGAPSVNDQFNFGQPAKGMKNEVVFRKSEEPFPVRCDVHPWMTTYCAVFDHPYFAVSGEEGVFALPKLAPGKYTIQAWHERLGKQTQEITVAANGKVEMTLKFAPPAKPEEKKPEGK